MIVATLTSGANKYYLKQGPYHNFIDTKGARGGHFFYPRGLWSILTDDMYQLQDHSDLSDEEILSLNSQFIDDDYEDQLDLTLSSPLPEHHMIYPSAASRPDQDIGLPYASPPRERLYSYSDPELQDTGCHGLIRARWKRITQAVRAWSTDDIHRISVAEDNGEGEVEGEVKRAATPL